MQNKIAQTNKLNCLSIFFPHSPEINARSSNGVLHLFQRRSLVIVHPSASRAAFIRSGVKYKLL